MQKHQCRGCDAPLTQTFVDLNFAPLSNAFIPMENIDHVETHFPLHTFVCDKCFLVQTADFETPENIFQDDYAYYSSFSSSWLKHAESYVEMMITRFELTTDSHVVEIASNDGYLLQYFVARDIVVTGVDPARNCAKEAEKKGVHTEVTFLDLNTAKEIKKRRGGADVITANNVLAHVPDINGFLAGIEIILEPNGVVTFEFPHLLNLIKFVQFDTIYHEHFSYLALHSLKGIIETNGLRVFDVETLNTHGGSLRIFACKKKAPRETTPQVQTILDIEKDFGLLDLNTYKEFSKRVLTVKNELLSFLIAAKEDGKSVAAYGAPAKGNTLLNYCGIGPEYIDFTVDLNPVKQGSLLPGSRIPIFDVSELYKRKPAYILILPWNLSDEIMQQIQRVQTWGAEFFVAIPSVRKLR